MSLRYSFELFPPRGDASAARLAAAVAAFIASDPEFVSVTFGAGGSSTHHSLQVLQRLLDGGQKPMAHLTCVGLEVHETARLVRQFLDAGVTRFLALRGDEPKDPTARPRTTLASAAELVQLIGRVEAERVPYSEVPLPGLRANALTERRAKTEIAVAAFPNGHPSSGVHRSDIDALVAKQAAGATMAITQLFFDPDDYFRFVELARSRGVTIPIRPGLVIPTSLRRLERSSELAGEAMPRILAERLAAATTPADAVRVGVAATVAQIAALEGAGVDAVHLYTFNDASPALSVLAAAGALARIPSTTGAS